jgi:hypothetical protein
MGCVVTDAFGNTTGEWAVLYSSDDSGVAFYNGENVGCVIGYADTLGADHLPVVPSDTDLYHLKITNPTGINDWDSGYNQPEDNSSYVNIFAKKADGTDGARCYGSSKIIFNWEG